MLLSTVHLALIDLAEFGGGVQTHTKIVFVFLGIGVSLSGCERENLHLYRLCVCGWSASVPFFHIQVMAAPTDIPFQWKDIGPVQIWRAPLIGGPLTTSPRTESDPKRNFERTV